MQQRKFSRVFFSRKVEISIKEGNDVQYNYDFSEGMIDNLSLKGMFIKTEKILPLNATIFIKIPLSEIVSIDILGRVIRKADDGVAVFFTDIDIDSFSHLKNIIANNLGDDEIIEKELNEQTVN